MIVRRLEEVTSVDWGNGLSRRFLTLGDGVGYTVTDTIVHAGTKSRLEYRNHLESCYCIAGSGEVIDTEGTVHPIAPGTLYSLDRHDAHWLVAHPEEDLRLVCVFTPALRGDERHDLDSSGYSYY
ncbi:ectoine synthase [Streptomyces sp. NPDC048385]|uniref:ectoine synthase n=1 Tax=Streptomyces sp. NPDC048385 TaxID=3155145 RepID=UPI00343CDCFC